MNKPSLIVACTAAFIGMGIAMPQCPGDKALQDQIDNLRQSEQIMTTKLLTVDGQNKSLQSEVGQTKMLITQLASAVTAQKDAIDRMDTAVKDLQTQVTEMQKKLSAPRSHSHPHSKSKKKHTS